MRNRHYNLMLGAQQALRERAIIGALRVSARPLYGMANQGPMAKPAILDEVLSADEKDPCSTLEAVRDHEARYGCRPAAVIPLNDWALETGLEIAQVYELPYLSRRTVRRARLKDEMKQTFIDANLPTPRHARFSTWKELLALVDEFGFPVVIKPLAFGGSGGVKKAADMNELRAAYQHAREILAQYADSFRVDAQAFLVEEYVAAKREISVEVLNSGELRQVLAVTDKFLAPEPYFAEIGHAVPGVDSNDEEIHSVAIRACASLGIDRGLAHVEIRIGAKGEYYLMEVGARPAGDGILDQVEKVYGIQPYELHVRCYLGEDVGEIALVPRGRAAICFLKAEVGRIHEVRMPDRLPEGVSSLNVSAQPGDLSEPWMCWRSREGHLEMYSSEDIERGQSRWTAPVALARELSKRMFNVVPVQSEETR